MAKSQIYYRGTLKRPPTHTNGVITYLPDKFYLSLHFETWVTLTQ